MPKLLVCIFPSYCVDFPLESNCDLNWLTILFSSMSFSLITLNRLLTLLASFPSIDIPLVSVEIVPKVPKPNLPC